MSKGVQIAVGAALVAALLGWYGWTTLEGGSYRYYKTLGELREAGATGAVRVHGYVAEGSIQRDVESKQVRFAVQSEPPHAVRARGGVANDVDRLEVLYRSLETPDLFKDGAEVVVEGTLEPGASVMVAENVLAKCPSKFQAEVADAAPDGDATPL